MVLHGISPFLIQLSDVVVIGDKMGTIYAVHESCPVFEKVLGFFAIDMYLLVHWNHQFRLFPLSSSEVVAVLANCSVFRISFSVCGKEIHVKFSSIPVLNHVVGCLSQQGLFIVDSVKRELYYVNKDKGVEIVTIDSLHHRFDESLPTFTLSFSLTGLISVSENRHDVYANSTFLFSTVVLSYIFHS